eukprot:2008567-Pleurochrysis_carterae.AAC.1
MKNGRKSLSAPLLCRFACRSSSKPGTPASDDAECWALVSTVEFALSEIRSTTMRDHLTGAFRPQVRDGSADTASLPLFGFCAGPRRA